jgi:spermidine synthase
MSVAVVERAAPRRLPAVHLLLVLSGFAGLGYQVVWTRTLSASLGLETLSALAVVMAFFAGLAIGALLLDGRVARSRRPGLCYAGLELAIALWSVALIWLLPWAAPEIAALMGPDPSPLWRWIVAFGAPFLLLAPATIAMGATTPAAERLYARRAGDGRGIGGLYAANALGAAAGALLTAAWLTPAFGHSATMAAFAALNALCAAAMLAGPARGEVHLPWLPRTLAGTGPTVGGLALLALTGFVGVGFEVAAIRALSQAMQNTVYSFAAVVAVYLLGTAQGAGLAQRAQARRADDPERAGRLAALTAAACCLGLVAAVAGPRLGPALAEALGPRLGGGLAVEAALALLVIGPPSAAMGALFTVLAQRMRGPDGGLGAAFAANTAGAAAAPAAISLAAVPALGVAGTLAVLALVYALLGLRLGGGRPAAAGGAVAAALAAVALGGPFDPRMVAPPPGGVVLAHVEGPAASASVTQDASGTRWLIVNGGFVMGGDGTAPLDRAQAHAALMLHPDPKRALFLGVGAGSTLAAATDHPGLRAEGVELLPEVAALLPRFERAQAEIDGAADRVTVAVADARRFAQVAPDRYDVIVSDNFHPAKDGAALLYTVEPFATVRERLTEGGVFMQWLPLHQLDMPTLRIIVRSFLAVFPDARLQMGNHNVVTPILALTGARDGGRPTLEGLSARPMNDRLAAALAEAGIDSPVALFGGFLGGPAALAAFAGEGPLNTDDHPIVAYAAPRTVYAPLAPAATRLTALIDVLPRKASDAVALPPTAQAGALAARIEAYWTARDAFIALGATRLPTGDAAADAAWLAPALIDAVRTSADFTPAYMPAVMLAERLAAQQPAAARDILRSLADAAPWRPEARAALARLGG